MPESISPLQTKKTESFTPIADPPKPAEKKKPAVDLNFQPPLQSKPPAPPMTPTAPADANVTAWPDAMLDHNALAIRKRLGANPASVSPSEKDLLGKIEDEIRRRDAAKKAPVPAPPKGAQPPAKVVAPPPKKDEVLVCARPADIAVVKHTGAMHWWLKTRSKEAGLGPANGGVPGENKKIDLPFTKTTINAHPGAAGKPNATCGEAEDVDEACVDKELEIGKAGGRWVLGANDCHTFVEDVLSKCSKPAAKKERSTKKGGGHAP